MKAIVDPQLCVGCGACVEICPALFDMEGDLARVKTPVVPPEHETTALAAAEACPVEAIRFEDDPRSD